MLLKKNSGVGPFRVEFVHSLRVCMGFLQSPPTNQKQTNNKNLESLGGKINMYCGGGGGGLSTEV